MLYQIICIFLFFTTACLQSALAEPSAALNSNIQEAFKREALVASPNIHQQIAQLYLSGIDQPASAQDQQISGTMPVTLAMNEIEQREVAFALINSQSQTQPSNWFIPTDIVTWQNLELFDGANLCATINRAQTKLGEAYFAGLLAQPTHHLPEIRRRQQIIRSLLEQRELRCIISKICAQIKQLEPVLLRLWKQENPHIEEAIRWLYIPNFVADIKPSLQHHATSLEVWRRQEDFGSVLLIPGSVLSLVYVLDRPSLWTELKGPFIENQHDTPFKIWRNFVYGWVCLVSGVIGIPTSCHQLYQHFTFINRNLKYLHTRYQPLAEAVQLMHDLYITLLMHHETLANFDECKPLIELFTRTDKKSLTQLLDELTQLTEPYSYWSHAGRILTIHTLAKQSIADLSPALAAIGAIDAYVGITRLFREGPIDRVRFSFPHLIAAEKPGMQLLDFWNPFVPRSHAVPNSLSLGGDDNPRGIVLTGQNTGGKSTVLKGVALSLWLGQTIGISPARQAIMTPFDSISSYLNITDKNGVKEGKSLFAAEVSRAKLVLDNVKSLKPSEKALLIIDEAFKGTGGEAEALSFWYGQQLAALPNLLCLNATHYPKLTKLEAETGGQYQNYKVEVLVDAQGNLTRPYKLEKGATYYNIAEYILIEQGLKPKPAAKAPFKA